MRVLDLFAGQLGWSKAFLARGWDVVAVDLTQPPEIPRNCEFLQVDVLSMQVIGPGQFSFFSGASWTTIMDEFDFICASSPCEQFSVHGMPHFHPSINTRLINPEAAEALATIEYRNTKFNERKLYTAWDSFGDEAIFFRGVGVLEKAGVPSRHLMAYMLVGCDPTETWDRIWHRFNRMVERGIEPYPMVFNKKLRKDLVCFQRWVITGLYRIVPWDKYDRETKSAESVEAWIRGRGDSQRG